VAFQTVVTLGGGRPDAAAPLASASGASAASGAAGLQRKSAEAGACSSAQQLEPPTEDLAVDSAEVSADEAVDVVEAADVVAESPNPKNGNPLPSWDVSSRTA